MPQSPGKKSNKGSNKSKKFSVKYLKVKANYPLDTIVQVDWADACGTGGWDSKEAYLSHKPHLCRSVGFLLTQNDDYITLVSTQAEQGDYNQAISIPAPWILRNVEIK